MDLHAIIPVVRDADAAAAGHPALVALPQGVEYVRVPKVDPYTGSLDLRDDAARADGRSRRRLRPRPQTLRRCECCEEAGAPLRRRPWHARRREVRVR